MHNNNNNKMSKLPPPNPYFRDQLLTYLGNKRKLIDHFIHLFQQQPSGFTFLDGFCGSGIISRVAKSYAGKIYANDWEYYAYCINACYLSNPTSSDRSMIESWIDQMNESVEKKSHEASSPSSFIYGNYTAHNDDNIHRHERVFFTAENGRRIDRYRQYIEDRIPNPYKMYLLGPLLIECGKKNNTCGYFNSFYTYQGIGKLGGKNGNDLQRICQPIHIPYPIFSSLQPEVVVTQQDINQYVRTISNPHQWVDIAYFDPPYNKHPYGTFYFLLNVIAEFKTDSPLPTNYRGQSNDWKRSPYNSVSKSSRAMEDLIQHTYAKQIWVSYHNHGILSPSTMESILRRYGRLEIQTFPHKTYNRLTGQGDKFRQKKKEPVIEYLYILHRHTSSTFREMQNTTYVH